MHDPATHDTDVTPIRREFIKPRSADSANSDDGAQNLSTAPRHRSLAGLVRERLHDIERRLAFGWYRAHLAAELAAELGRPVSLEAFKKALWRARQRRSRPSPQPVQKAAPRAVYASAAPPVEPLPASETTQRPAPDLRRPVGFDMARLQPGQLDDLV